MTFDEYQCEALRTALRRNGESYFPMDTRIMLDAIGLAAEAGEVCSLVQHSIERQQVIDRRFLVEELGDCMWRVADLCSAMDIDLGHVADVNIAKLRRRHPDGFTPATSAAKLDEAHDSHLSA